MNIDSVLKSHGVGGTNLKKVITAIEGKGGTIAEPKKPIEIANAINNVHNWYNAGIVPYARGTISHTVPHNPTGYCLETFKIPTGIIKFSPSFIYVSFPEIYDNSNRYIKGIVGSLNSNQWRCKSSSNPYVSLSFDFMTREITIDIRGSTTGLALNSYVFNWFCYGGY